MHEKILNPAQSLTHGIYASQIDLCPNKFYAWMVLTFPTWRVRQNLAGILTDDILTWMHGAWSQQLLVKYGEDQSPCNSYGKGNCRRCRLNVIQLGAGKEERVGRKWKGKNFPRDLSH